MTANPRARWAEQLSAPPDAPPDAARAAFLRALPGAGFLPPAERVAALDALAGVAVPLGPDDDVERLLRDEVEAFATNYWSMEPVARLTTWAELSRRGAPAVRLRELEPGLDVTSDPIADPGAEELAALFRALFVLPARVRAIRRNEWLLERADSIEMWRAAVVVVQRDAPALVALEPHLRRGLSSGFAFDVFAGVAREDPEARRSSVDVDVADFTQRMRDYEQRRRAEPERVSARNRSGTEPEYAPATKPRSNSMIGVGFLIGLSVLVKILSLLSSSDTTPRYSPPYVPGSSATAYPQPGEQPVNAAPVFSVADVAEFHQYENDKAAGKAVREPAAYAGWWLAGRPAGTLPAKLWTGDKNSASTFTGAEVAEFLRYEREKAAGRDVREPLHYKAWSLLGSPGAATAVLLPGPNERLVHLGGLEIVACQNYELVGSGRRPPQFDDWVKAGKPAKNGFFIVPQTDPMP